MKKVILCTPELAIEQARRIAEKKTFTLIPIEKIVETLKKKKLNPS